MKGSSSSGFAGEITRNSSRSSMLVAMCIAMLALVSFATTVSGAATVVYVNGATGSDSNKGTAASPYKTLNHTVSVLCANVNPEYVVVVAAIPAPFIYMEGIYFPTGCEALSVIFTPVDPSDPAGASKKIEMPQVAWITWAGAIMSLTFDHISFKDVPFSEISMNPTLDLGATATYTLTVQNCLFEGLVNGTSINLGSDPPNTLQSGIVLNFQNNIVQSNRLSEAFIYSQGPTSVTIKILSSQFLNNSVSASYVRIVNANTANFVVIDSCTIHNNTFIDLLFYLMAPSSQQPPPPATTFNFTNNDVSWNNIGGLLDVSAESGPTFISGNRIENNILQVSSAAAYFGGFSQPIVISDNLYTCNNKFSNYYPPLFSGSAPPNTNWVLSNNKNGDAMDCAIVPGAGMTMADAINAIPCPAGTSNPGAPGDTTCYPCEAGTYADQPGSASCTYCPQGSFAAGTGAIECTVCPVGTHGNSQGLTACQNCNSGKYASEPGEIVCQICAAGTCTPSTGGWSACESAPCSNSSAISLE